MARAAKTDFLQNFRFRVSAETGGVDGLKATGLPEHSIDNQAGFQSCSIPEMSVEPTEYREGIMKYTRKFPGIPTVTDVSLTRGVVAEDTTFFRWMIQTVSGGEYRSTIVIQQYSRTDVAQADTMGNPTYFGPYSGTSFPKQSSRDITCYECMPMRVKPGADLDATSGEVSMQELDFALEYFSISGTPPLDPKANEAEEGAAALLDENFADASGGADD